MANLPVVQTYGTGGHFRIFVRPPGSGTWTDVTFFRNVPTQINSLSSNDPFGDATAQITFPGITGFERGGQGDLFWLVPWADVDIAYFDENDSPTDYVWEGMMVSEEIGDGLQVQLKGALYQLDNFLAAPTFPQYPIPYELLISQTMDPTTHTSLRTGFLQVIFPPNWPTKVPTSTDPSYLWFLRPWGVVPGQSWTGLTTRSTGSWENALSGFVQSLLSVMYTDDGGQWTIIKKTGRIPVMQVRQALRSPDYSTMHVYFGAPGVEVSVSRDFTQMTNVIYGQGTDLAGSSYSGQEVTSDGSTTYYEPFAYLPQYYPATSANSALVPAMTRKESRLTFPQGMDELSARDTAATQLRRFADPGYVGTITLTSDPTVGGANFSRMLVRAGSTIVVHGLRGTDVLFHVSSVEIDFDALSAALTVDTKFRDALTTAEVAARTRDALDPVRLLQIGKFSTTVQDEIKPWSYSTGSGCVPSDPNSYDSTEFFTKLLPPEASFPWTTYTQKYPPKNSSSAKYYIPLHTKSANATNNWSGITRNGISVASIPVKMAQAGTIRLSQFMVVDANGNPMQVRFHLSLYGNSGIGVTDMPLIPTTFNNTYGYPASQRYPFFPYAFEQFNQDGTETTNVDRLLPQGADLVIGWGNYYEPAGYSPGMASTGAAKTGRLVDESTWTFDTSSQPGFDKYSTKNTQANKTAGMLYVMVYCDDQGSTPAYLIGRMFRQEPGSS